MPFFSQIVHDLVFLHLLDWDKEMLTIPQFERELQSVYLFGDQTPVVYHLNDDEIHLTIPSDIIKPLETILVFQFKTE